MGCCQEGTGALHREANSGKREKNWEKRDQSITSWKIHTAPRLNLQGNPLYRRRKEQIQQERGVNSGSTEDLEA